MHADETILKEVWKTGKRKSWLSTDARKLIKRKGETSYRKARKNALPKHWCLYCQVSNHLHDRTRRDHMTFVGEMTANVKSLWRWVKKIKSSSNIIPQIAYQNRVFNTDKHKAEVFNNYFCSVHTDKKNMRILGPLLAISQ